MSKARGSNASPWTQAERKVLARLDTPEKVQRFLNRLDYSTADHYCSPRDVIRSRRAHCFDGALFAAAALRMQGLPPLIMDLVAVRDDDHVLAVYRQGRCYGAVAKSNFAGLRWREPVYRSLRELAMSYFDGYYNFKGERTLRAYSVPLNLASLDSLDWMTSRTHLDHLAEVLDRSRHYRLLTNEEERRLSLVDTRSFASGIFGANKAAVSGIAARYRKVTANT